MKRSPPSGDCTVMVGGVIWKAPSLVSVARGSFWEVMRMRAWLVVGPITRHGTRPSLAVVISGVQLRPLLRLISISTSPGGVMLAVVQRICCVELTCHISPPLGWVTVMLAVSVPVRTEAMRCRQLSFPPSSMAYSPTIQMSMPVAGSRLMPV